jgi:hypothetical protein
MSQTMPFKTKLKLLFTKSSALTDDEKAIVKSIGSRIIWGTVLIIVGMTCMGYYTIFRDNPPGPPRDMMLQIANAMSIGLASSFIGFRIVAWAARMRPGCAIPVAILASAFAVVGSSSLFDVALRLKSDVARAEVRGPALGRLSQIIRPNGRPQDVDAFIQESADFVRALQDPQKIRELHAENDRVIESYRN